MRILLITHFFPPLHNAGTENYTLGLAKSLQLRGNEVQVVSAEDWNFGKSYWNGCTEENYQGVPVKRIHLNWEKAEDPNRVLYYSETAKEWLSELLKKELFDVVHIVSTYALGVGIMESVKAFQIPLILTLMDFWFICPSVQLLRNNGDLCDGVTTASQCQSCQMAHTGTSQKLAKIGISQETQSLFWGPLSQLQIIARQRGFRGRLLNIDERKQLLKEALELPDLVLSHSRTVKQMFAYHTPKNIRVLQNGHDLSWLSRYKGKKTADYLRIGYVGQIASIKGVHVLVEAFKKAGISGGAKLEIWGGLESEKYYVRELQRMIDGDPSISLNGRFSHDDLADVFCDIDVLVVPSLWYENAPLVIQESFAARTPVITTNVGGMAEAVSNEVNGLLFERGNADDLARQLRRLEADPDLFEKLKAGIPKVKTVEEEVGELEKIYHELIQKNDLKETKKS